MASSSRKPTSSASQRMKEGREKVRVKLTEEQRRDMRKAYDLFDPNGTGSIDVTTIMASMRALGPTAETEEIQKIIPFYGRPNFGDFLKVRTGKKASSSRRPASSASARLKEGGEKVQVKLTEVQTRDMKTAFDLFDPHGRGTIDMTGILVCLRVLGLPAQKDEIQKMLPVSGKIDFGVFLRVMIQNMGNTRCEEKMTMVFHLFDDDCTGKISFENLKRVAEELEEYLTDEELQEMIDFADKNGDGEVNKKEFLRMMKYD